MSDEDTFEMVEMEEYEQDETPSVVNETELTAADLVNLELVKEFIRNVKETDDRSFVWMKQLQDVYIIRYLYGHKMNPDTAIKYLKYSSGWRQKYGIDEIHETFRNLSTTFAKQLNQYYPVCNLGHMPSGDPVVIYRLSMVDFPGLLREFSAESLVQFNIHMLETSWRNFPKGNGILILDLGYNKGETPRPMSPVKAYVSALLKMMKLLASEVDPHYPESFKTIFITRPPAIFWATWKVAKYFIVEETRKKVRIFSGKKGLDRLQQAIDPSILPSFLNGSNTVTIPCGKYYI